MKKNFKCSKTYISTGIPKSSLFLIDNVDVLNNLRQIYFDGKCLKIQTLKKCRFQMYGSCHNINTLHDELPKQKYSNKNLY